jgi:hypothetical protein
VPHYESFSQQDERGSPALCISPFMEMAWEIEAAEEHSAADN